LQRRDRAPADRRPRGRDRRVPRGRRARARPVGRAPQPRRGAAGRRETRRGARPVRGRSEGARDDAGSAVRHGSRPAAPPRRALGGLDDAARHFREATEKTPRLPAARFELARTLESLGRAADARAAYEAYLREAPASEERKRAAAREAITRLAAQN